MEKAIRFLSDPAVIAADTTDDQKRQFLRTKGITDADIDAALASINAPPPVPPVYNNGTVKRRATQWLFVLLLAGGTVFYHYRRILLVPKLYIPTMCRSITKRQ